MLRHHSKRPFRRKEASPRLTLARRPTAIIEIFTRVRHPSIRISIDQFASDSQRKFALINRVKYCFHVIRLPRGWRLMMVRRFQPRCYRLKNSYSGL